MMSKFRNKVCQEHQRKPGALKLLPRMSKECVEVKLNRNGLNMSACQPYVPWLHHFIKCTGIAPRLAMPRPKLGRFASCELGGGVNFVV